MRHLASLAAFALCLVLAVAVLDRVGRSSEGAGVVWVVTRGNTGSALAAVLAGQDLRVLDVWIGGRVVQLHADSLARVRAPEPAAALVFRMPLPMLALPACG